ncbi:hypothetical protein GIB67_026116 [Kingdonia uniflora]|uniref:BHLH domain-containing protein n=1 Tax=Kingdonia uniflora TaxID=39325 RepID=A0A7J7M352_9MAGN|nr:hypothetical protein GIB67_026116 [Kingdonia uniflora]
MEGYPGEFCLVEECDLWSGPFRGGDQDQSLCVVGDQWRDISLCNLQEALDWNFLSPLPCNIETMFHESLPTTMVESPCIQTQPQQQQQQQQEPANIINVDGEEEEEEDDDEEEEKAEDKLLSRNLVSERNRRKRLNEQLCALRSQVPHVTKMNKRAILSDAFTYLKGILEETAKEEEKLTTIATKDENFVLDVDEAQRVNKPEQCRQREHPEISQMEVDMVDREHFMLKLSCSKEMGVLRSVQRMIESLGMDVTSTSINPLDEHYMTILSFLHVTKKSTLTQNQVVERVKATAAKLGIITS